jgi:hypothetical protein
VAEGSCRVELMEWQDMTGAPSEDLFSMGTDASAYADLFGFGEDPEALGEEVSPQELDEMVARRQDAPSVRLATSTASSCSQVAERRRRAARPPPRTRGGGPPTMREVEAGLCLSCQRSMKTHPDEGWPKRKRIADWRLRWPRPLPANFGNGSWRCSAFGRLPPLTGR